ncbi:MAG: tRNA (N6-threonylcarbamoyladenosine(37)-N6)-methyltransferase TrmO [Planctomycetes bacterium]|nr:tRNA (N6-threonylcarbamoyladenosine(37)-N6)-methyltransferase TrmO [Planctomycetota bacterium]
MKLEPLTLRPIGVIRTPFTDRYRAPRQPGAGDAPAVGVIELEPRRNFEQALEDLAGFERIWIVAWFHRNKTWKPKVLPPRGSKTKRGLFATRSPHRPNPIGLSLVRLLAVTGRTLRVEGVDLLDGTPILDLKPYLPYAEAFPNARIGWLEAAAATERNGASFEVTWSALAREQSGWLRREHGIDLHAHAEHVLRRDPAPHPYRRISQRKSGGLQLALKSWRILFSVAGPRVLIERIVSGYSAAAIAKARKGSLHDHAAQVAFRRAWPAAQP